MKCREVVPLVGSALVVGTLSVVWGEVVGAAVDDAVIGVCGVDSG